MYLVERSPLLIIFRENVVEKTICTFGFHFKGKRCLSDPARLILRPDNLYLKSFSDSDTLL